MSRITKWKLEKTKVKVVFRLQFHATDIPQSGWDKLFISFVPSDSGKATAKTTKAIVRNGTCKWADPIYETTRLLQDTRSKGYDDKLYKLVVAMGSSHASILGEAIINLADYAAASKPSSVSIPLHRCTSGTILHVTVQLLTSKTGFREFEQQRELREGGLQPGQDSKHDDNGPRKETEVDQVDKVNARVRFKNVKELSSVEEQSGRPEVYPDSSLGRDDSSNTSESMYAEKHDSSSGHEIDSLKSTISGDLNGLLHGHSPQGEKGETSDYQVLAQGRSDSIHGWNSDYSIDNDLPVVYEENHRLRESLELAESTISELQVEINTLQSQANEIGSEMHKLTHQVASEVSSGEELAKDVSLFRSECSKLKNEVEMLRNLKINTQAQLINRDNSLADHPLQQFHLVSVNGVLKAEDRIRELKSKTFLSFHERDLRFLHSELDEVLTIIQDTKRGTVSGGPISDEQHLLRSEQMASSTELDLDLALPESLLHHLRIHPLVSPETGSVASVDAMKNKMFDLMRELEDAKFERENLIRKMHQMECYYEALIQELDDNQKQMLGELQNLRTEHSSCVYAISSSKAEAESVRREMGEQLFQLSQERQDLDILNKDLERRASTSEAALRRARLNYSIAVEKLQKDLELLSSQIVSMFETNENITSQPFPESSQTPSAGNLGTYQNADDAEAAMHQHRGITKPRLGSDILLEDLKRSLCLQEELYKKVEEEIREMQFDNLHLDIFSKTLQEILREADADIGQMKEKFDELARALDVSNVTKDQLTVGLQSAMEEIQALNNHKASGIVKFKDMALENQTLECNLETAKKENSLLVQKISDSEKIFTETRTSYLRKYEAACDEKNELSTLLKQENTESARLQFELSILKDELETFKNKISELASLRENLDIVSKENNFLTLKVSDLEEYKSKYEDCCAEKAKLSDLLKQENLENSTLQNEILVLEEKLTTSKDELNELAFKRDNLEENISCVQDKLISIILGYNQQFKDLNGFKCNMELNDFKGTILQLEEVQNTSCGKILELMEEKKISDGARVSYEASLRAARAEILAMKKKFNSDMQNMTSRLDTSNILVGKLQFYLESVAKKFNASFEVGDQHAEQTKELLTDIGIFGVELQEITLRTGLLDQGIMEMKLVSKELERNKSTITELERERESLSLYLEDEVQKSMKLKAERDDLKCSLSDELHVERTTRENIEGSVRDLTFRLEEAQEKLLECNQQLAEMRHFAQLCSDLELENSRLNHLLLHHEESLESLIASDVKFTVLRIHCDILQKESAQHIKISHECLGEQQKSRNQIEATLNNCLANEVRCREENAELTMTLKSLRSNLEASVSKRNAYDDVTAKLEEYQRKMAVLEAEYLELQKRHIEIEARLNDSLATEACSRDENKELMTALKSLRSDLEASVSKRDAYENITTELEEHQKKLAALEADYMELQESNNEITARLHDSIAGEARSREENEELTMSLKSLRSDLEDSIAVHNSCGGIRDKLEEYQKKMAVVEAEYMELQERFNEVEVRLNDSLVSEASFREENAELIQALKSMKSDLETSVSEHSAYDNIKIKLEESQKKIKAQEAAYVEDNEQHDLEVDQPKDLLAISGEEIDFLMLSNEELEIIMIVLKDKFLEQHASIKKNDEEIKMLKSRGSELTLKLSEQVLKTEEFKNLSLHFKELKDKVEADCAREKREPAGPPVMQESLRIVFIKEQYETRLQELRQQLSISRKHAEEMLFKLQDSLDEIENRKKSEALQSKRNEELSGKLLALEADLKSALFYHSEKNKVCDELKTKLECAVLSLECCKEEKGKVESYLRECEEEKDKITVELTRIKEIGEVMSTKTFPQEDSDGYSSILGENTGHLSSSQDSECKNSSISLKRPGVQEIATSDIKTNGNSVSVKDMQPHFNSPLDVSEARLKTMNLRTSMEHLQEELERMKNENSFLSNDEKNNPEEHLLQGEIMQLHMVNEQLRNMFPLLDEISISGNALERVLALEIELAESLRAKSKSNIHFQSSFLKQHSDEAAVLRSFRDINELIREMLELKGKYASLETELNEMHDRYSQLSLQFAEVEGDRQKLKMNLKNIRAARKLVTLNRSPTGAVTDYSP